MTILGGCFEIFVSIYHVTIFLVYSREGMATEGRTSEGGVGMRETSVLTDIVLVFCTLLIRTTDNTILFSNVGRTQL